MRNPIESDQAPPAQILLFRANDIEKQDQEHRANRIATDGQGGSQSPPKRPSGKVVLPYVLDDQQDAEHKDDQHHPAVLST